LQCAAVSCSVRRLGVLQIELLSVPSCSVLQRVAVCCSVLQRVAACCSVVRDYTLQTSMSQQCDRFCEVPINQKQIYLNTRNLFSSTLRVAVCVTVCVAVCAVVCGAVRIAVRVAGLLRPDCVRSKKDLPHGCDKQCNTHCNIQCSTHCNKQCNTHCNLRCLKSWDGTSWPLL